jgi:hypothetical protein
MEGKMPRFEQFVFTRHPGYTLLTGKVTFAAGSGAVGTVTFPGVTSVTKQSDGCYRFLLSKRYKAFLGYDCQLSVASTGTYYSGVQHALFAQDVTVSSPYVEIAFSAAAGGGGAANPYGCTAYVTLILRNNTVAGK